MYPLAQSRVSQAKFFFRCLRARSLIDPSNLEDLRRVDVRVVSPAHDSDAANHALVDLGRDATVSQGQGYSGWNESLPGLQSIQHCIFSRAAGCSLELLDRPAWCWGEGTGVVRWRQSRSGVSKPHNATTRASEMKSVSSTCFSTCASHPHSPKCNLTSPPN